MTRRSSNAPLIGIVAVAVVGAVASTVTACKHGHGPHITLNTPSAPTPDFGDAPSMSGRTQGPGGGGGESSAQRTGGGGSSTGQAIGTAIGVAAGAAGLAVTAANGGVACEPGVDTTATADAGTATNLCSGERKPAAPDVERAFRPGGF